MEACPTPSKHSFETGTAAKKRMKQIRHELTKDARGNLPKPYPCVCGMWHLGHMPSGVRPPINLRKTWRVS